IKIYVCNVMTQPGETDGYTASMHVKAILDHAGRHAIDYVIVNSTPVPKDVREMCAEKGSYPVKVDEEALNALGVGLIKADLITSKDAIHHDPKKLASSVMRAIYGIKAGLDDLKKY
ncbi:MAG: YvcK family protein, partial [Anaerovibrio sp.]|nr:YvcK family protein [Anaerovibrio sp.]